MSNNVNPSGGNGSDWESWDSWDSSSDSQSEPISANTTGTATSDWGSSVVSEDDDWNFPTPDAQVGSQPSNDDWDLSEPSSESSGSDWDLSDGNGQFISQQDNDNHWSPVEDDSPAQTMHQGRFDNGLVSNNNPVKEVMPKKKVNLGTKSVGLLIALLFVILALVFMFFDGVSIKKKPKPTPIPNQGTVTSSPQTVTQAPTQGGQQGGTSSIASGSVTLIEIPVTTSLNYSGDILETSGTVLTKTKYVQAHQVLYCITIRVAVGSSVEDINYYCNFASYSAVKVGDLLVIKYQQVDDNYISVNEVLK